LARHQKRLTRKEIKEDKVADFFLAAANYTRKHSRKITGVAIGILIVLLVITIARRERAAAEIESQTMLARANLDLKQGNYSSALQGYQAITDRFRGTWGYADAVFLSADANFATARYDSAMLFFEKYLNQKKRRDSFTISAKVGVAQCLEQLGRSADAAESYLKVAREHPSDPFAPDALFGAARCYELLQDLPKAQATYQDLIDRYPKSRQANLAKMPLLEIQARLEKT
jgi:TolA-binding protein